MLVTESNVSTFTNTPSGSVVCCAPAPCCYGTRCENSRTVDQCVPFEMDEGRRSEAEIQELLDELLRGSAVFTLISASKTYFSSEFRIILLSPDANADFQIHFRLLHYNAIQPN